MQQYMSLPLCDRASILWLLIENVFDAYNSVNGRNSLLGKADWQNAGQLLFSSLHVLQHAFTCDFVVYIHFMSVCLREGMSHSVCFLHVSHDNVRACTWFVHVMCVCTYLCMYVCMHACMLYAICICICFLHVAHDNVSPCMWFIHAMCVCTYLCVCVYVCMLYAISICICIYIRTHGAF